MADKNDRKKEQENKLYEQKQRENRLFEKQYYEKDPDKKAEYERAYKEAKADVRQTEKDIEDDN